jgi:hypothetical protein
MLVRVLDELSEEFSQVGEVPYVKCAPPWRDGAFREFLEKQANSTLYIGNKQTILKNRKKPMEGRNQSPWICKI